jgi:hypothetical protein
MSVLDKLKIEARERELERKVEATKRVHVKKERVDQVCLTRVIYIEPLALHEPIAKEVTIFE